MNKKISVGLAITVAILAMTVTFSVTMILAARMFDNQVSSVKAKETMYSKLADLDKFVRDNAFGELSDSTLNDTMASGYVLGIGDRNAKYYTAKAYSELLDIQSGKLMGIGVDVVKDPSSGYGRIVRVSPDSPAADLGFERGGFITKIGEVDVKTLSDGDAILSRLRGEDGTTVDVTYMTPAMEEKTETITHRSYKVITVESQQLDTVGYIRISSFGSSTAADFSYAVNQLLNNGATSLVFDLRNNSGSTNLSYAVEAVNVVCPEGIVAFAEDKSGSQSIVGESDANTSANVPMVCLVNGNTAWDAELFAASVSQMAGGKLVGLKTAGKGAVLCTPQRMDDGSAVVLTTARLLTHDYSCFDGTGLAVDTEAALSAEDEQNFYSLTPQNDSQIQKAVSVAQSLASNS